MNQQYRIISRNGYPRYRNVRFFFSRLQNIFEIVTFIPHLVISTVRNKTPQKPFAHHVFWETTLDVFEVKYLTCSIIFCCRRVLGNNGDFDYFEIISRLIHGEEVLAPVAAAAGGRWHARSKLCGELLAAAAAARRRATFTRSSG